MLRRMQARVPRRGRLREAQPDRVIAGPRAGAQDEIRLSVRRITRLECVAQVGDRVRERMRDVRGELSPLIRQSGLDPRLLTPGDRLQGTAHVTGGLPLPYPLRRVGGEPRLQGGQHALGQRRDIRVREAGRQRHPASRGDLFPIGTVVPPDGMRHPALVLAACRKPCASEKRVGLQTTHRDIRRPRLRLARGEHLSGGGRERPRDTGVIRRCYVPPEIRIPAEEGREPRSVEFARQCGRRDPGHWALHRRLRPLSF